MHTIVLRLDDLASGGDAVGRYEGKAVFVPFGIPGEKVSVEIVQDKPRFAHARLLQVLEPSPERVEPPCPYHGLCGGCQWQHISYAAQLQYKQGIVVSDLQRIGGVAEPLVLPIVGMDDPWGYRNHVQLHYDSAGRLGFQAYQSHDVVPIERCLITHPLLDELWNVFDLDLGGPMRIALRAGIATGEAMVVFEGDEEDIPELEVDIPISCVFQTSDDDLVVMAGSHIYHEELLGRTFQVSAASFFQVNTEQASRLVQIAIDMLDPQEDESILDAYCGVGTFSLTMSGRAGRVTGIESSPWAVEDAWANGADCDNVEFVGGDVNEVLGELGNFDAALIDPPRAGCTPETLDVLTGAGPQRIVYVSCNPSTLARDVKYLAGAGFELVHVQPVDMFPHTMHVECVALLRKAR